MLLPPQVIKESQRLFPAAAIGPLRYAASNTELAGYFIPKGTHIQVHMQALYFCVDLMPAEHLQKFTERPPHSTLNVLLKLMVMQAASRLLVSAFSRVEIFCAARCKGNVLMQAMSRAGAAAHAAHLGGQLALAGALLAGALGA